eukprot:7489177-Ditylum_brightwellii.AAC.1
MVDRKLIVVYRDTIHDNDGSYLNGEILDGMLWKDYWRQITALFGQCYNIPTGCVQAHDPSNGPMGKRRACCDHGGYSENHQTPTTDRAKMNHLNTFD